MSEEGANIIVKKIISNLLSQLEEAKLTNKLNLLTIRQLNLELNKYKEAIAKFKDLKTLIGILNNNNLSFSFNEILQELESGDSNEN